MKFYRCKHKFDFYLRKIENNKLSAICIYPDYILFYKNGLRHNSKNASYIYFCKYKEFNLNGEYYGYQKDFTKKSWRRFVKMQVFK